MTLESTHPGRPGHRRPAVVIVCSLVAAILAAQAFAPRALSAAPLYPDDPSLAPGLAGVAVDSGAYRSATVALMTAQRRLADAEQRFAENQAQIGDLVLARSRLTDEYNDAVRRRDKAGNRLELLRASLRQVAVENYVMGGAGSSVLSGIDLDHVTESRRNRVLLETVNINHLIEVRVTADLLARSEAALATIGADLGNLQARVDETTAARDQAITDGTAAREEVAQASAKFSEARLEAQVVGLGTGQGAEWGIGFQLVALDAYVKATATMTQERPGCRLRWQAIAGFARVESAHGTYLGRHVAADGQVSEDVIGIALDGNNKTAVIRDTDRGAIDGDPVWDRAVGPLAFIPAAWRQYGRDGNGDGVADPQNIYDGALATANLICSHGYALDTEEGLRRAAFSYNPSTVYVDMVVGFIDRYDAFTIP